MLSQEQLIGYLEGTLSAAERAQVEGLLADDPAAQRQLAEQRGLDQALHVLLGDATSNERVKQSILAVVRAAPAEQLKARVLADTSAAPPTEVGVLTRWIAKLREWSSGTWAVWGPQGVRVWELVRRLSATPARRVAAAAVCVGLVLAAGFFWLRPSPAPVEIGKFTSVMGAPKVRHRGQRSTLNPRPSALVYLGDRIETGDADKAELQFQDGTRLSLNFNTTIQIPSPASRARGPTPVARPPAVRLLLGQLSAKVQAATNQAEFAVHTPVATAAVRGTEFGLNVRRAGTNTTSQSGISNPRSAMPLMAVLTVKAGRVEFFNAFGKVQVTAMTESTARIDSAPTEPRRLTILKKFRFTDAYTLSLASTRLTLVGMSNTKRWVFPNAAPALSVRGLGSNTVVVAAIHERTAADRGGIQEGDIIAALNGQAVRNEWQVRVAWAVGVGQPLTLTLRRDGDERQVTMTPELQSAPALPKLVPEVEQPLHAATRRLIEQALEIWEETPRGKAAAAEGERELLRLHAQFPNEAAVLNNLGVLYESRDMVGKAIQQYQQAVSLAPEVGLYHFNLGCVLQNIGNDERAMEEIQMAVRLEPQWLGPFMGPISVYTSLLASWDRPEEALAATETALSANPSSGPFWSVKGALLQRLGRLEEARDAVLKAIELDPSDAGYHHMLGGIYLLMRQFDQAEKALKRAIELNPTANDTPNLLGLVYKQMGRWAEAQALFRQVINSSAFPAAFVNLGGLYHERQNYSEAETMFRRALQADPDFYDACVLLAKPLGKQGKWAEAEESLRKAIELEPGNNRAYVELGRLYAGRAQLQDAERMHRKALELNPDSPSAAAALADFLDTHGRPGEAEEVYRGLLKTSPNDPEALNGLALFLAGHGQQLDEALALARRALQAQPDNPDFLDTLGWTQFKRGEAKEAEETLKKAIAAHRENPSAAESWQRLAAAYEAKGDQQSAAEAYRQALKLYPDSAARAFANFLDTHGRPGEAEEVLRGWLKTSPHDPEALNTLAYFLADYGQQLDEALALARRALQAQPDNPYFLDTLGWTQFKRGEVEEAQETLKKAIAAHRENPGAAVPWQHLAAAYEAKGDQHSAAEAYRQALKLRPDSPAHAAALANFLDTHGRPSEAEEVLRGFLKTSPNAPQALNELAYVLACHGQQLDEALALVRRALQAQPDNPAFLDTLGWTQFKRGEVEEAQETLKKAIAAHRENPSAAESWQHLAAVCEAKGDQLSAADAYRRALKLQPDSKEAAAALQRLGP